MRRGPALLALLLLALAGPAAADWLLLTDGSRVQTQGAWQVRGPQVVFTLPNGTFGALRTADVDLDGSARITAEAKAPKPEPTAAPPPPRKAVIRVTDADLRRPEPAPTAASPTAARVAPKPPGAPGAANATAGSSGLEVMSWAAKYEATAGRTTLSGTVHNTSDLLAYNVKVVVSAFGRDGGLIAKSDAPLSVPGLPPGGTGNFELRYPGSMDIQNAKFEITADRAGLQRSREESIPVPTPTPAVAPTPPPPIIPPANGQRLQVASWQPDPQAPKGAVVLVGELLNATAEVAANTSLQVTLRGKDGQILATAQALLGAATLRPGEKTTFRVTFPGVAAYGDVQFASRFSARRAG